MLPDIFNGENTISPAEIEQIFDSFTGSPSESAIDSYSPNRVKLNVDGPAFLVVSEKYSLFPGWKVSVNNNQANILRANRVISSVYIKNPQSEVDFFYSSSTLSTSSIISGIAVLLILAYFVFSKIHKIYK